MRILQDEPPLFSLGCIAYAIMSVFIAQARETSHKRLGEDDEEWDQSDRNGGESMMRMATDSNKRPYEVNMDLLHWSLFIGHSNSEEIRHTKAC